ncbi:hypothetical protein [Reyranella sp.]|uniref:hypothetical protein n=1 Tax=Reyranella sp. TaxID=1929291 RepID=UPI003D136BB9
MPSLAIMYGLDLVILLLAIASALAAGRERGQRRVRRWHLLIPGLASTVGALILLSYPDIRDLADPQMWTVGLAGLGVGALRGWAMRLDSDHAFAQVRLSSGGDAAWVAWALVLLAALQGAIETGLHAENPYEATAELLVLITSGYLLGRSMVAWLRARSNSHVDLQEE